MLFGAWHLALISVAHTTPKVNSQICMVSGASPLGTGGGDILEHISELIFDAILEKMLKRYSARYLAVYLRYKAAMCDRIAAKEAETADNRDV